MSIFISPNIPLDEEGNLVTVPGENVLLSEEEVSAPPGYGQHVLDQLYDDVAFGFQTPEDRSGANSPYYQPSAFASLEDLTQPPTPATDANPDAMAALASRLQRMTDARSRRNSIVSLDSSHAHAEGLSRQISNEDHGPPTPGSTEHDEEVMETLNKVPSYATAVRTPARPRSTYGGAMVLPMYEDIETDSESGRGSDGRPSTAERRSPSAEGRRAPPSRPMSGLSDTLASRPASHEYQQPDPRSYLVG